MYRFAAADMQLDLYAAGAGSGDLTLEEPILAGVLELLDCLPPGPEEPSNEDLDSSGSIMSAWSFLSYSTKHKTMMK